MLRFLALALALALAIPCTACAEGNIVTGMPPVPDSALANLRGQGGVRWQGVELALEMAHALAPKSGPHQPWLLQNDLDGRVLQSAVRIDAVLSHGNWMSALRTNAAVSDALSGRR